MGENKENTEFRPLRRRMVIPFGTAKEETLGSVKQMIGKDSVLITSHWDNMLRIWNLDEGECSFEIALDGLCTIMEFCIGYLFIVTNSLCRAFDIQTRKVYQTYSGHKDAIFRFVVSGNTLYTASADKTIRGWNIKSGECLAIYEGHKDAVTSLDLEGGLLVTGSVDKNIGIWNAIHVNELARSSVTKSVDPIKMLIGHQKLVFGVKIYDGILLSASLDGTIKTWNLEDQKIIQTINLTSFSNGNFRLDFRIKFEDNLFIYSNETFVIAMVNLKSGKIAMQFQGHKGEIKALKYKYDHLFSASADKTIKKWSIKDGTCKLTLKYKNPFNCMAIQPEYIVTGADDGVIGVWDIKNEEKEEEKKEIKLNDEIARLKELGLSRQFMKPFASREKAQTLTDGEKKNLLKEVKDLSSDNNNVKSERPKIQRKSSSGSLFGKKDKDKKDSKDSLLSKSDANLSYGSSPEDRSSDDKASVMSQFAGWFVGAMERQKAEQLLLSRNHNCFLIRVGSIQGCFAISKYNSVKNIFNHVLIMTQPGGFVCQDSVDTTIYKSLNDLVENSPEVGLGFRPVFDDLKWNKGKFEYVDFMQMEESERFNLQHTLTTAILNSDNSHLQTLATLINYNLNGTKHKPHDSPLISPKNRKNQSIPSRSPSKESNPDCGILEPKRNSSNNFKYASYAPSVEVITRPRSVEASSFREGEYIWYEEKKNSNQNQLQILIDTFPRIEKKYVEAKFKEFKENSALTADFLERF